MAYSTQPVPSGKSGAMLEEDPDQTYENVLAEIQSFELPIEATLR